VNAWDLTVGAGPIVAVALHAGHEVRPDLMGAMAVSETDRLREEDPSTGEFARGVPTRLIVRRSRFEVDLNRPRERAVYWGPDDAWGLTVWRVPPGPDAVERSLAIHDAFYERMAMMLDTIVQHHGGFVLLDLHSYNHRRSGSDAAYDDPADNPGVNLGTGTLDRQRWAPVVDTFTDDLANLLGPDADVRENVKFRGGNLARWVHSRYETGCCLAIEFKKTYMDEWTGKVDDRAVDQIADSVAGTVGHLHSALTAVLARA
jgi:hypothetical protein